MKNMTFRGCSRFNKIGISSGK